jgi:HD-like signal output (HDOD) protein
MPSHTGTLSDSLEKVPPFPPVAAKLLELLADPDVDANEVADLLSGDATFTGRLLQRANSARFGVMANITSVRRAVALLGLDTARQITLAQATAAYASGALKTEALRRSWQHSVATAVLAEEIAFACEMYTSVAFTGGIMHDIGRLGLLVAHAEEYQRLISEAPERGMHLLDLEHEVFGFNHAEAGRMLIERWRLPEDLAVIAGCHHDLRGPGDLDALRIVHVACRLADVLGYEVVTRAVPETAEEILVHLPARGREALLQAPGELLMRIEERIRDFGGERPEIQPEEALALLSNSVAGQTPAATPQLKKEPESRGVAHALVRAVSRLISTRSKKSG